MWLIDRQLVDRLTASGERFDLGDANLDAYRLTVDGEGTKPAPSVWRSGGGSWSPEVDVEVSNRATIANEYCTIVECRNDRSSQRRTANHRKLTKSPTPADRIVPISKRQCDDN